MVRQGDQAEKDMEDYTMGTGSYGNMKRSDDRFNKGLFQNKPKQQPVNQQQANAHTQKKKSSTLGVIIVWGFVLFVLFSILSGK